MSAFTVRGLAGSLTAIILLLLILPASVEADGIILRNGQTLQGLIVEVEQETLKLQLPDGQIMEIQTKEVRKMQYDLGGLRICYTLSQRPARNCTSLLRQWGKDAIIVVQAPDYRREDTISLKDIREMEIWVKESQSVMHYLADVDARGEIELRDRRILKGKISQDGADLHVSRFFSSDSAPGTSVSRIAVGTDTPKAKPTPPVTDRPDVTDKPSAREAPGSPRAISLRDFYPGYQRWNDDRRPAGFAMMSLFTCSALSSAYFGYTAAQDSNRAQRDPTTILFNNQAYLRDYQGHYRSMSASGFVALGLLLVNTVDVLWIRQKGAASAMNLQFHADYSAPSVGQAPPFPWGRGESIAGASFSIAF